jgi:DNA-binding NarL/FixJ family response regulator
MARVGAQRAADGRPAVGAPAGGATPWAPARPPRRHVAVVDEQEVFRRGLVATLSEQPVLEVVFAAASGAAPEDTDVAVVSARAATSEWFDCPVVVCADEAPPVPVRNGGRARLASVLPRSGLTEEQLVAAVRAAAAGLHVNGGCLEPACAARLDARRVEVLRLLAEGADTQAISHRLCYSVRTIKSLIQDIERELRAASRAQAVAEGIRQGII